MKPYKHAAIEKKWQAVWEKKQPWKASARPGKKRFYGLIEFPYPSGAGLHVGHIRSNTAMDIIARKHRMRGYDVLYPIGWDAFGLPTENYAIKTGIHPKKVTKQNTDTFREQLKKIGFSFDWSREVDTTDPEYYKWTQWIFLQLYKKGLAYKAKMPINWCLSCKIGLANEEVVDGTCERCGGAVEQRVKEQWMLAITKYADRLYDDLDTVDFIDAVKTQQRNWIGRSEGAEIAFPLQIGNRRADSITVFTTRADTLYGATFLVLAPEHPWVSTIAATDAVLGNAAEVRAYIDATKRKSDLERQENKEKTGVCLQGVDALNPATGQPIPVFIADYVLPHYGTGAIMAVPAHDERDFAFAQKFGLAIKEVVAERFVDKKNPHVPGREVIFRDAVIAIIHDPRVDRYLTLDWKQQPWTTFVMGGIEQGEDPLTAAIREIREETGYRNVKLVRQLRTAQSEFYAAHKGVNRIAHTRSILFELIDDSRDELAAEEAVIHTLEWRTLDEILARGVTHAELSIITDSLRGVDAPFTGEGILINSGPYTGTWSNDSRRAIAEAAGGKMVTTYKLRDWVFSRQRYWGEPIPMIRCESCGWVPVPEKDLPVKLPTVKNYEPTDTGESPLSAISSWVKVKCPQCKKPARRETDTMPNWAGSSWYFLRYADPKNKKALASKEALKSWTPIDWYNGGMEHTTLHLLYSRFWHKFLYDIKVVPTKEPYKKRTSHGMILAENGVKMSKSKGNVINPDDIVKLYGADTLRLYEMFMGPFSEAIAWNTQGMIGVRRFLERVWKLGQPESERGEPKVFKALEPSLHALIKKVSEDIDAMKFNTAIAAMMSFLNEAEKEGISRAQFDIFLTLLAPFAPHITEELWQLRGRKGSVHAEKWPTWSDKKLVRATVTIAVQINGKLRATIIAPTDIDEHAALVAAKAQESVAKHLDGMTIRRVIYVPSRLLNIVL